MSDPRPMIENSDRGITLAKPLAWTILVAIVTLVWWGGTTIQSMQSTLTNLGGIITETRLLSSQSETRIRALEVSTTRNDAVVAAIRESLTDLKNSQAETNRLLRNLSPKGNLP
jgi:uncharacterized coiled-coil protein SlyX